MYSQTARQTVSKLVFYAQSASTVISGRTETDRLTDRQRQRDRQTEGEGRRERASKQASERASETDRQRQRELDYGHETFDFRSSPSSSFSTQYTNKEYIDQTKNNITADELVKIGQEGRGGVGG